MGKKVVFDFAAGETRKAVVEAEGFEPFEITFRMPTASDRLAAGLDSIPEDTGGDDALAAQGRAIIGFVVRQLTGWSLPEKCERRSVEAIADGPVLLAIYQAITAAGRDRKNS